MARSVRILAPVVDWDKNEIWHHGRPHPREFEACYDDPSLMPKLGEVSTLVFEGRAYTVMCIRVESDEAAAKYKAILQETGKPISVTVEGK